MTAMTSIDSHPRRGAALIIVLLFAALITMLAATAARSGLSAASASAAFVDLMRADELARAAADLVAVAASTGGPSARRGGSFVARLETAELSVDYLSEAARIDINAAPPKLLGQLFAAAASEPGLATDIAERVERARRSSQADPNGQRQPDAASGSPAIAFERVEQIVEAWSIPDELYRAARPALTVGSRSAKVDPTLAGRLVILTMMNADQERTDEFMERRMRGFTSADEVLAQFPETSRTFAGFTPPRAYRASIQVSIGRRFQRHYEAVVAPSNGNQRAARIISWQPVVR
jgi:general secretion pathway protein K